MRELFGTILFVFFLSCKAQKENPIPLADTAYSIQENEIAKDVHKTFIEKYIASYIDSINNATNESDLPKFLSDNQFDFKHRGIWTTLHNPISVRAQVINRVNNCKALLLIVESKNTDFKKKPHMEDELSPPFIEFSFYDLALKRIDVLDCK